MKYSELIQFEPITSVIQLKDSENASMAKEMVKSYVISDLMAKRFTNVLFPLLRWDNPIEHQGLLVVGNYGTGKSHLMSVVASVASDKSMMQYLRNDEVRNAAETIAGKFKVVRIEIGGVTTSFRPIFVNALQEFLDKEGIDYTIPPTDVGLTNNKGWMEEMMAAFHKKYPDHGLLFVVDEMLDYFAGLLQRDLQLSLGLMREIGEFAKNSRFRFIGGLQEMIFSSPRFNFVAESLNRVAQRFQTLLIERNDVKFVVSERLLSKTAEQMDAVRKHLEQFAMCYDNMASRMDEFCRMYPIHPDYFEVFERIVCVERREVLKSISFEIKKILNQEVLGDHPGIIAFDSYWEQIKNTPALQAVSSIKSVTDCANALDAKIGSVKEVYRPLARRVIDALAVHRLTTGSLDNPIGLTAANIRDMLCVYDPLIKELGGDEMMVLEQNIGTTIDALKKAVSGQYVSKNGENQQYYIDVHKIVDVEENIRVRADVLDPADQDSAYYEALKVLLELQTVATHLNHANIWQFHDVQWFSHKSPRCGYLFFGAPNERDTAYPPRDYYVYFLRPFDPVPFKDQKRDDEVFFKLTSVPDELSTSVKTFAASLALANTTAAGNLRDAYQEEAKKAQKRIVSWLYEKGFSAFDVIYKGEKKKTSTWLANVDLRALAGLRPDAVFNFRELAFALASYLLEDYFCGLAPQYPKFREFISKTARDGAVSDAIGVIAGGRSKQGLIVLDALKLLDGEKVSVENSPYALKVRSMLKALPEGQVLNHDQLLQNENQQSFFDLGESRLEADYFLVVLAALVSSGDLVINTVGHQYGAADVAALSATSLDDLMNFLHVSRPKGFSQESLAAVFDLVGLEKSCVTKVLGGDKDPIVKLQSRVTASVNSLAMLAHKVSAPVLFMGVNLLELMQGSNPSTAFAAAKDYLEHLLSYDTPAKLKNLHDAPEKILAHKPVVTELPNWEKLFKFIEEKNALLNYLTSARDMLGPDDLWSLKYTKARTDIQTELPKQKSLAGVLAFLEKSGKQLQAMKGDYIKQYLILHKKSRLDAKGDAKRQQLLLDPRLKSLTELAEIQILPKSQLVDFRNKLNGLVLCDDCLAAELEQEATCPRCHYSPARDGAGVDVNAVMSQMGDQLAKLLDDWTKILLNALSEATVQDGFALLSQQKRKALNKFIDEKTLPDQIPNALLEALKEVLNGLKKVVIASDSFMAELKDFGPMKLNEFKACVERMIDNAVKGEDQTKVRLVVE